MVCFRVNYLGKLAVISRMSHLLFRRSRFALTKKTPAGRLCWEVRRNRLGVRFLTEESFVYFLDNAGFVKTRWQEALCIFVR